MFTKELDEEFETGFPFFLEKTVGRIAGRRLADRKEYDEQL